MKLTPEQKQEKKLLEALTVASNRIRSDWSFHKIKTFGDLLRSAGYNDEQIASKGYFPSELNAVVDFSAVKEFISDREVELSTSLWLRKNPPDLTKGSEEVNVSVAPAEPTLVDLTKSVEVEVMPEPSPDEWELPPNKRIKCFLYWFQKKAVKQLLAGIVDGQINRQTSTVLTSHVSYYHTKRGQQLIAGTGTGKTFIIGATLAYLLESKFHQGKTFSPWPYVVITKASVVEQTKRVLEKHFSIDTITEVQVIGIDQLRSKFGGRFLKQEIVHEEGEAHRKWMWRPYINPILMIWDESHALKNLDSQQSQIGQAYNDILDNTWQIFSSATPYTRVIEAKCFAVSTRVPYKFGFANEAPLLNTHFNDFAKQIADPASPEEYSPAAVERLTEKLEDYIVRVKGVKPQFKAKNHIQMIGFATPEEKVYYEQAWERYQERKAKLEGEEGAGVNSKFLILVEMLKFSQAAELCRAPHIAKLMWQSVAAGKAAVAAVKFKQTIIKAVDILVNNYNVSRDQISLIWGGGQTKLTKKQKAKKALMENEGALAAMEAQGITLEDLDLDDVEVLEQKALDPSLRLGNQDPKERQREIDRFQSGKSVYCMYTFRAGGVGLSLHHTDELTTEKVRHKPSGYAVEEDIPKIPTRPRINFVAPTYSAIELVQGLGRCPRLTSLSDTEQILLFYRGTIEERIARIVAAKLRCLTKVVRQREDWSDMVVGGVGQEDVVEQKHISSTPVPAEDEEDQDSVGITGDSDLDDNNNEEEEE
jgi:hypothetical protein